MAASNPASPDTSTFYTAQTKPTVTINPAVSGSKSTPLSPTTTLDSLQSIEQLHLLNEIDKLRAHGVNDFVSLPQIVVCGDQSSGKSSVLEAITEIPFPRKDSLCTRFATQIVLRRGATTKVLVKILPDSKRPENERKKLAEFTGSLEDFGDLPSLIERAQEAMGITSGSGAFSKDVLSIEISGPGRPQLTVVDLPGLTHTENKSQSRRDVELVSELVQKYMTDPRTIVLAIVTAKNDYANQIVLTRAKEVDPDGVRTLGIITKPDTLPEGSDSEHDFFSLAMNEDIFFKLGWHVLRNRTYEERNSTFEDRNHTETAFFEKGVWRELPRECVGISALRTRLSSLLLNRIKKELPRVYKEIGEGLKDCENKLSKLGQGRSTVDEQRVFLSQISEDFVRLCKASTDGIYEDEFFGDAMANGGTLKRLRSVIQYLNSVFAENIRQKGHSKSIVDNSPSAYDDPFSPPNSKENLPQEITREAAIQWVKPLLLRSRGRELPGTYNPLLIGEVFWEQSRPWEAIAYDHLETVFGVCQEFLEVLLQETVPGDVFSSLFNYWIHDKLRERFDRANSELKSLLADRRRHAITYNHYCTDSIQRTRAHRMEERYTDAIKSITNWDPNVKGTITIDPAELLRALSSPTQDNLDDYACEEVLDGMSAFYQIASKVFIDNVAIQVVERQVIGGLWEIFSPSSVVTMTTEMISDIAEESTEDQQLRERLEAKRKSLKMGMEVCRGALKGIKPEPPTRTPLKSARKNSSAPLYSSTTNFENLSALLANANIGERKGPISPKKVNIRSTPTKPSTPELFAPMNKETRAGGVFGSESGGFPDSPFGAPAAAEPAPPYRSPSPVGGGGGGGLFKVGGWGAGTAAGTNANHGIFGPKPGRTGNPSFTKSKHPLVTMKDGNETLCYHSISYLPEYQKLSFEEVRLQEYAQGKRWGA